MPNAIVQHTRMFALGTFDNELLALRIQLSVDGTSTFEFAPTPVYTPPSGSVRDPSITFINGLYFVAHTAGTSPDYGISIASSPDLVNWTHVYDFDFSAFSYLAYSAAPEWFIDTDGSVYLIIDGGTAGDDVAQLHLYLLKANDGTMTNWTAPTLIAGSSLPSLVIDGCILKVGSTYHLVYKNETTKFVGHATATAIAGPYTQDNTDYGGFGTGHEGPQLFALPNGGYQLIVDQYEEQGLRFARSNDLVTWTSPQIIAQPTSATAHGTLLSINLPQVMRALSAGIKASGGSSLPGVTDDGTTFTLSGVQMLITNTQNRGDDFGVSNSEPTGQASFSMQSDQAHFVIGTTSSNNGGGGNNFFVYDANTGQRPIQIASDGSDKTLLMSLNISSLPTSSSGLSGGDVWNDGGTLKIA